VSRLLVAAMPLSRPRTGWSLFAGGRRGRPTPARRSLLAQEHQNAPSSSQRSPARRWSTSVPAPRREEGQRRAGDVDGGEEEEGGAGAAGGTVLADRGAYLRSPGVVATLTLATRACGPNASPKKWRSDVSPVGLRCCGHHRPQPPHRAHRARRPDLPHNLTSGPSASTSRWSSSRNRSSALRRGGRLFLTLPLQHRDRLQPETPLDEIRLVSEHFRDVAVGWRLLDELSREVVGVRDPTHRPRKGRGRIRARAFLAARDPPRRHGNTSRSCPDIRAPRRCSSRFPSSRG
jgi:hypothetical protein